MAVSYTHLDVYKRQVLHLLTELAEDRQILLFTCQHREFFMLEDRPEITTVTLPDF